MNLATLLTRVVRHSAVYGIADLVGKAIGFLLVPLYTRTLSQAEFGQLQVLFLIQTFGVMTVGVGQVGTLLRYHARARDEDQRRRLLRGVLAIVALGALIFLLLGTLLAGPAARTFLGTAELSGLLRLLLVGVVARVLGDLPLTLLRVDERSGHYAVASVLRLLTSLGLIVYFVVIRGMGLAGVVLGEVVASLVLLVSLLPELRSARGSVADRSPEFARRELLRFGWPFMIANLGAFGLMAIDRLFLAGGGWIVEAGIYSLGAKVASLLSVLVLGPFTLVWGPLSFRIAEENEPAEARRLFARVLTYFAYVLYVLGLGLYLFSPQILALAGPPEYASADRVVPLLIVSTVLYGLYRHFQVGLSVTGRTRAIATSFVLASVANIAGNAILVPTHGMMGAAIATGASYLLMTVFIVVRAQSAYPVPYEWKRLATGAGLACGLALPRSLLDPLPIVPSILVKALLLGLLPIVLLGTLPRSEQTAARRWLRDLW